MKHKQLLSGLSAVMMTAAMLGTAMPAFALDPPRYGDFNQDGVVDGLDAQLVLMVYAEDLVGNPQTLTEWEITIADVNFDGVVDLYDSQFILLYYAENTLAGNETSWEEIINPVTDYDLALDTLTKLMDGIAAHDVDALFEYTDIREVLSIIEGTDVSEEELRAEFEEKEGGIDSYRIIGGGEDPATMTEYNAQVAEIRADAKEALADDPDEETRTAAERVLKYLQPLDCLYVFTVEAYTDGEPDTAEMYVACRNGKWYVDTLLVEMLVNALRMSKISSANTAAKSVYNAFNSAAIDLDNENYPLGRLDGVYVLNGADFENLTKPSASKSLTEKQMLTALCCQTAKYFSEITEIPQIAVYIKGGACRYAAAAKDFDGKLWFGCYPNTVDPVAHGDIHSVEDALAHAMQYE